MKDMITNGIRIFVLLSPAARIATYSESPDILLRQNIVEKKMDIGTAIGIKVVMTLPIIPNIKPIDIVSEETRLMILSNSNVIKKEIKKIVLTTRGIIKFVAI